MTVLHGVVDTHDCTGDMDSWTQTHTVEGTSNEVHQEITEDVNALKRKRRAYLILKRVSDIVNALIQIVLFSPIMLIAALAIKLYDNGPVFFLQERITGGADGPRKFKIVKFRTMVCDAENHGRKITPKNDTRITPVGRLLRRFKIDEIPQLLNILKGDMSFVGPRPQTLGYVDKFKKHYEFIHSVVPAGLTDLATIRFRNEEELLSGTDDPEKLYVEKIMPDKINWHILYVKQVNPLLDFWILFMTIVLVCSKR